MAKSEDRPIAQKPLKLQLNRAFWRFQASYVFTMKHQTLQYMHFFSKNGARVDAELPGCGVPYP